MTHKFSNFIQKITYWDCHWFLVITHNRMKQKLIWNIFLNILANKI